MYKLKKPLYGLKQAPRAWYERLTKFLVENGYRKGGIDKTLFTKEECLVCNENNEVIRKVGIEKTLFVKEEEGKIMIAQIYVDDIMFGGMSNKMFQHFVKQMQSEFEMSLVL